MAKHHNGDRVSFIISGTKITPVCRKNNRSKYFNTRTADQRSELDIEETQLNPVQIQSKKRKLNYGYKN